MRQACTCGRALGFCVRLMVSEARRGTCLASNLDPGRYSSALAAVGSASKLSKIYSLTSARQSEDLRQSGLPVRNRWVETERKAKVRFRQKRETLRCSIFNLPFKLTTRGYSCPFAVDPCLCGFFTHGRNGIGQQAVKTCPQSTGLVVFLFATPHGEGLWAMGFQISRVPQIIQNRFANGSWLGLEDRGEEIISQST
jgi:hypothetical protein